MAFTGFPPAAFSFLEALEADNSKRTFEAYRAAYDDALIGPAKELVPDLGAELARGGRGYFRRIEQTKTGGARARHACEPA
mgnify:CR=1 FL=1